ncbi:MULTISPECIES: hypothetical protein [unclassified Xanthobacter]|uniref:hypothetical protein n=1 Tax=unclassified Xanthobacter TaxID=2623496 RepID=UPI001EDF36B3|nr:MULTISPECIES: hypothetical protein [unclassified Xanthobacter]
MKPTLKSSPSGFQPQPVMAAGDLLHQRNGAIGSVSGPSAIRRGMPFSCPSAPDPIAVVQDQAWNAGKQTPIATPSRHRTKRDLEIEYFKYIAHYCLYVGGYFIPTNFETVRVACPISQREGLLKSLFGILSNNGDGDQSIQKVTFLHCPDVICRYRDFPFCVHPARFCVELGKVRLNHHFFQYTDRSKPDITIADRKRRAS